ncbi:hypothetical protein CEE37_05450 [candidate division LCP-89 bacterium B3_LCP]|uniref:Secretion system C-terminal sorting domain-containing protein n=1 Tax=candidate division LCP-89 bacterium B3_LCP TaxID=2012998 RepID=A0A532V1M7_UNCL8|nr:MAG: hypothetical protein CEE37_05450 [candidate division LCP-89 bacterium B3_LCP]
MSGNKAAICALIAALCISSAAFSGDSPKGPPPKMFHNDLGTLSQPTFEDSLLWLDYVNGTPEYAFSLPDEYNDHYHNVRFYSSDSCKLIKAAFCFFKNHPDLDSTGIPGIHILIWENDPNNSLYPVHPGDPGALDSVIVDSSEIEASLNRPDSAYTYPIPLSALLPFDTLFVELDTLNLAFSPNSSFHVGWEPEETSPVDSIALIADDGWPSTDKSIEWWDSTSAYQEPEWRTIESSWGIGADFYISVQVEVYYDTTTAYVWLEPDRLPVSFDFSGPYPNPFNPETTLLISLQQPMEISLNAYDLTGRLIDEIASGLFPAGQHPLQWQPQNLASGTYILQMKADDQILQTKAVLIK